MTANQIAWAGLKETERHNTASESETNRHNLAEEGLKQRAIDVDEERNRITDAYNTRKNDLDDAYNKAYIKMNTALGSERNAIQAELNEITRQKNDNENSYHVRLNELTETELTVKQEAQEEVARHNKEMESIEGTYRFLQLALDNKRAEYQNTYWRNSIDLGYDLHSIQRRGQDFDFLLGQGNLNLQTSRVGYQNELDFQHAKLYSKQGFWADWDHPLKLMSDSLRLFQ